MNKAIIIVPLIMLCSVTYSQNKNILMQDSFESADYSKNWRIEGCCENSIQRSDSVSHSGKYSVRVELNRNDAVIGHGKRAELSGRSEPVPQVERWYSFSVYLPKGYEQDSVPEIIAQWHEVPDFNWGETWRSPPISLQIVKGYWRLGVMWAADSVNTNATISGRKGFYCGNFETAKWTDWIFHIKFSYRSDGLLEIWKNGEKKVDYHGPNYYNDQKGPFFKIGIYKWEWLNPKSKSVVSKRVLFFDDVKIGNKENTYESMNASP